MTSRQALRAVEAALRERGIRYMAMGSLAFCVNFLTFSLLSFRLGVPAHYASPLAYLVGGQAAYLLHSNVSFHDRHGHWRLFMTGNLASLGINWAVAAMISMTGAHDLVVYFGAIALSSLASFSWNNFVSHGAAKAMPRHRFEEP